MLIPPDWIDDLVLQHGPSGLAAITQEISKAGSSGHVASIAISQRLPPGRLFVIADSSGSVSLAGTSPDSSAHLPHTGQAVDFKRLDRFANTRMEISYGSSTIHWWVYEETDVEETDDPRSTREILDGLLARHVDDPSQIATLRQSFGGIAGSAKSMSMQRGGSASTEQVYLRLRRAFGKKRQDVPNGLLDDSDFDVWLRKRAHEITDS